MSATNHQLIARVLESANEGVIQRLLDDRNTVFWVDWRGEDDTVVRDCESILQTGKLSADLVEVETDPGWELYINYHQKRVKVPLTYSNQDRQITICSLNEALATDYEIRYCTGSKSMDTLAFLPLSTRDWARLNNQYGPGVGRHFYRICVKPNLFTDPLPFSM